MLYSVLSEADSMSDSSLCPAPNEWMSKYGFGVFSSTVVWELGAQDDSLLSLMIPGDREGWITRNSYC